MKPVLVFVYGTLKRPYGNSRLLEYSSRLVGDAVTVGKYYLANCGIPYLVCDYLLKGDKVDMGKPVLGQVWEVYDEQTMSTLDALEGVRYNHYQHLELFVSLETGLGEVVKALAYHTGDPDVQEYGPSNVIMINGKEVYQWER